jgi:uncharacterized protein (DUF302 family)
MTVNRETGYTFSVRLNKSVAGARAAVEPALKLVGFGILTEIDVAATLKDKLGIERAPYLILGVCNPSIANRALTASQSVGTLLPCTVVVRADGDGAIVEFLDPKAALSIAKVKGAEALATEAHDKLMLAATSLAQATEP